jgi:hypothetical protein
MSERASSASLSPQWDRPDCSASHVGCISESIGRGSPKTPAPKDDELMLADPSGHPQDSWVFDSFRSREWTSFGIAELGPHYSSIFQFAPVGFHYFLPTYLSIALFAPNSSMLIRASADAITPPPYFRAQSESWFMARASQFNGPQAVVIKMYVRCMRTVFESDLRWARVRTKFVISYWSRLAG